MTTKTTKLLLGGLACGAFLALSVPAMAIPIAGSATWTGVFTLTNTGLMSFCPPVTPVQTPCPAVSGGAPGWNVPGSGTGDLAVYGSDPNGGTIITLSQATNPVGVTLATRTTLVTDAVKVISWPNTEGLADEVRIVCVFTVVAVKTRAFV